MVLLSFLLREIQLWEQDIIFKLNFQVTGSRYIKVAN